MPHPTLPSFHDLLASVQNVLFFPAFLNFSGSIICATVFMDDSEYLKVHWLKPPTTRVAKSFCCFAIVGFGLFTLWLASLPPSIALVKNLASHAKPSQESLKIENHLPPPDFLLPSNDYFDLESHRNTSHVIYDPFVRGVTRGQWPNERHSCIGPRGVPMDTDEHSKLKFYQPIEECKHCNYHDRKTFNSPC